MKISAFPLLDTKRASEHLAAHGITLAPATARKKRIRGGGPRFHKFGHKVFYTREDLDAWVSENLSPAFSNTSQPGFAEAGRGA